MAGFDFMTIFHVKIRNSKNRKLLKQIMNADIKLYGTVLGAGLGLCPALHAENRDSAPNLLVVMADQFRGDALGFRGKEAVRTPNLDAFSQEAVVFTQAVSGYPVSSPARGMFLSGAYPHSNGVITNCQSESATQNVELKESMVCWSDVLKSEGYQMAYIGKWHLDKPVKPYIDCSNNRGRMAWNEWCPPERRHGFDYWVAYGTYDQHLRPMYWDTDGGRQDFYYVDQWGPEYEADLAIKYIESRKGSGQPFAMMVSMNPPHTGYELVPDKYKALYKGLDVDSVIAGMPHLKDAGSNYVKLFRRSLANYYACISGVDEQFGRIIQALKRNGLFDNTIVVFVSDHGDSMGMHENIGKNIFYEEAVRVPFLISWGKELAPRMDNDLLISLEDFCPTVLSLMGLKDKIPATVQTRDLSRQVRGSRKKMPDYQLYMRYSRVDETGKHPDTGLRGVRDKRYTYAVRFKDGQITGEYLFDRQADPYQMNNIAEKEVQKSRRLRKVLVSMLSEAGDPAAVVFSEK